MPYCSLDDVKKLFPASIWPTSLEADFAPLLDEAATEIDTRLAVRYVVPVTGGPSAASMLQSISARMVATMIHPTIFLQTPEAGPAAIPRDWTDAEKLLADLAAGKAKLLDATPLGTLELSPGSPSSSLDEDGSPQFTMEDLY
jgi:hypothetical protein